MKKCLFFFILCFCGCGFQFQYKIGEDNTDKGNNVDASVGNTPTSQQIISKKPQNCLTNKFVWPQYQRDAQHTGLSPYRGPKKGKLLFKRDFWEATSYLTSGSFLSMDTNGHLYFADGDTLFIFNGKTQKIKQKTIPAKNQGSEWLMPIFDFDGNLHVAPDNQRIWVTKNSQTWLPSGKFADFVDRITLPVIDCDNNVYVVIKVVFQFKICSIKNTEIKWCTALPGGGFGKSFGSYAAPAVGRNGEVYVTSSNYLTALDTNGKIIWKIAAAGDGDSIDAAAVVGLNGDIYFGINGSSNATRTYFYCVGPNGEVRWYYKIDGAGAIESAAAISPDSKTVYFVADNNYLYALNSEDGKLKWRYSSVFSDPRSSPVVDSAGTIYTADDRQVVAISAAGKKIWQFSKDWNIGSAFSNLVIAPDGTLYVLYQRAIYAFKD